MAVGWTDIATEKSYYVFQNKNVPNGRDKVELENSGRFVLKEKMIPKPSLSIDINPSPIVSSGDENCLYRAVNRTDIDISGSSVVSGQLVMNKRENNSMELTY